MKNELKNDVMKSLNSFKSSSKACGVMKKAAVAFATAYTTLACNATAFAATEAATLAVDNEQGADLDGVVSPIVGLINSFVNPLLALVGAGGVIFCIMLGVKYATAEEPQEKEKRKQSLKTAIIGFVLIFVLIVALKLSIGPLTDWMNNSIQSGN
ncbi:MAG: pilin [Eubacterium sp.]|nr:pilin [Eubacterium sp.]